MATAIPFTVPNEFSNGAAIVAAQHNANWDYVEAYCEQLSDGSNIAADAIVTASIIDNAVTAAKIATGTITTTQLATALQQLLVPAGTITATIRSTADAGYLLLAGQPPITGADLLYPSLWAVVPASWKSGTSLVLPNMANKLIGGVGAIALGALGGDNTILEANLPSHAHTLSAHTHTLAHSHQVNPPSTEFTSATEVESPGTVEVVYNTNNYSSPGTDYRGVDQAFNPVTFGMALRDTSDGNTHTHKTTVDIAEFTSGGASNTVTDGPNTPNTSSVGGGTDLRVEQLAVNFQIKAH